MADYTGKAQFFLAIKSPPELEAEGDRIFDLHAEWMERTHPRDGAKALHQYTVSKSRDDDGNAIFLLAEVYETKAGITNHRRLAVLDPITTTHSSPGSASARSSAGATRRCCTRSGSHPVPPRPCRGRSHGGDDQTSPAIHGACGSSVAD